MGIIIALEGDENYGKSSAINLLISKMIMQSQYHIQKIEKHHDWRDKTYVFHINDKVVMITTIGDDNKSLSRQLFNVSQEHPDYCDIIVYAKRSGTHFECINDLITNHSYSQIIVKKQNGQIKNALGSSISYIDYDKKLKEVPIIDKKSIEEDTLAMNQLFSNLIKHL